MGSISINQYAQAALFLVAWVILALVAGTGLAICAVFASSGWLLAVRANRRLVSLEGVLAGRAEARSVPSSASSA